MYYILKWNPNIDESILNQEKQKFVALRKNDPDQLLLKHEYYSIRKQFQSLID